MADDIDSMLNEEERNIEMEELKEERERAKKRKPLSRGAPFGIDEDIELTHDVPGELGHIDHHAEERRAIEETMTPKFPSSGKTVKKKNSGHQQGKSQVTRKPTVGNSTKKQKERYSKE